MEDLFINDDFVSHLASDWESPQERRLVAEAENEEMGNILERLQMKATLEGIALLS